MKNARGERGTPSPPTVGGGGVEGTGTLHNEKCKRNIERVTPQSVGTGTLYNTSKTLKDLEGHVNQFKLLAITSVPKCKPF
jgi:hypothetical protein